MEKYYVGFWNLENLFAEEDYPQRGERLKEKLKNSLKGWTKELVDKKMSNLTSIISQMNEDIGPDILGVCEVENAYILKKLANKINDKLPNRNYNIVHSESDKDKRGIDTAFIYDKNKFSVDENAIFSHFVMRRTGTRDIIQATFSTIKNNELVIFCNHWPSRSGGAEKSEGFRMTAGETLSYWHQRVNEIKGKDTPVIAFGDFNDDPFDQSVITHALATREKEDVIKARSVNRFYNLSWNYLSQTAIDKNGKTRPIHGTLYYNGNANIFDQIFVSKKLLTRNSKLKVDENSAKIVTLKEMVDSKIGQGPIRFGSPKKGSLKYINTNGFSDHFPVSIIINEN